MKPYFRDFLYWLSQWNAFKRDFQIQVVAAVLADVYVRIEEAGHHPRTEVVKLIHSGLLSPHLCELLDRSIEVLNRLEDEYQLQNDRLPNAAELKYGADLDAEKSLKAELSGWYLPF